MSGTLNPGPVVFDYTAWTARYPEFATVASATAQLYFNEATLYLDNSTASIVQDGSPGGQRATLLNMLTAHIAALASAQMVGRIASATQGSVTVATDYGAQPGTAAWFNQTKYGAQYWSAVAMFRTMQYACNPGPFNPSIYL